MGLLDECIDHSLGVRAGLLHLHEVACLPLHQSGDLTVVATDPRLVSARRL